MNKKEVIAKLKEMDCDIAIVVCDIASISDFATPCYPNESFIVYLVKNPCNDDLVINGKHWAICSSIKDFNENVVYGKDEARKKFCGYYVSDFKEVKEFVTDF